MAQRSQQSSQSSIAHSHAKAAGLVAALAGLAWPALAQEGVKIAEATPAGAGSTAVAAAPRPEAKELLDLFVHYVLIDRQDLAKDIGQELVDRGMSPADFTKLVESADVARFEQGVARAIKVRSLEPVAARMAKLFEDGKLMRARDPQEIAANIEALTQTARARLIAQARLKAAGEYAMPQLLSALLDSSRPILQSEVQRLMADIGRPTVMPLAAALPKLPPAQQELVANVMGSVGVRSASPFLADLAGSSSNEGVKAACQRALEKLGSSSATTDLYAELAEAYYRERLETTAFPGEEHQLLWNFEPGSGLQMVPVKTPVFHEAMAMRFAERSLELSPEQPTTLALWIASNLKREIQTPEGYANPAYPTAASPVPGAKNRREAMYFAVAAGAPIGQLVLGRAMDSNYAPLARKAIEAIEKTAGGSSLWTGSNAGASPLVRALNFPNRRVQYEAALALAAAQPREAFGGAERVVPTLAGAIREAGAQVAAVVSSDAEAYQSVRKLLESKGFTVLPAGRTLADLETPISEAPAIDLVVVHNSNEGAIPEVVSGVRAASKTSAVPVMVLTGVDAALGLSRRYDGDPTVSVRASSIGEEAMTNAITQLVQAASGGPISKDEAGAYRTKALSSLRDLAVANNQALKVDDAATPLIAALAGQVAGLADAKLKVGEILAWIGQDRAQRALMDAALAAQGDEKISMLGLVAGSAKRFGNRLEDRQVTRLVELAQKAEGAEGTAAAALMGALNLPNKQLMPLVLEK